MKQIWTLIILLASLLAMSGCLDGSDDNKDAAVNMEKAFKSSIGMVEIDIPYAVELGDLSDNDSLQLIKPGTTKPIISINLWDSALYKQLYPTFQEFAESFVGAGHTFEKMTTDDGKPMLFCAIQEGTDRDGNPNYSFSGYIDDSEENGKYVVIHAPNVVRYEGKVIATYTEEQFAAVCKSFRSKDSSQ